MPSIVAGVLLRFPIALAARLEREHQRVLLCDYFPKGTDLSSHSSEHLLAVEHELNNRPDFVLNHGRTR